MDDLPAIDDGLYSSDLRDDLKQINHPLHFSRPGCNQRSHVFQEQLGGFVDHEQEVRFALPDCG